MLTTEFVIAVKFLATARDEIRRNKGGSESGMFGGCGYIAAMRQFDNTIRYLLDQNTQIESLENSVEIMQEEIDRYIGKYGALEEDENESRADPDGRV